MGLTPNAPISRKAVDWEPGRDLLALWTDGMVESRSPAGEMFGEARLLELLVEHRGLPVEEIITRVFAAQDEFSPRPGDDRTLVVMRV
jgi:sigma-B regulation protein RsbU (phosphoserine phosphatase)